VSQARPLNSSFIPASAYDYICLQERFAVRTATALGKNRNSRIGMFARGISDGFQRLRLFVHTHVTTGVSVNSVYQSVKRDQIDFM
jgi:hypothetical protein